MNLTNYEFKKALGWFISGHSLKSVAQYIDVDFSIVQKHFESEGITNIAQATEKLASLKDAFSKNNQNGGRWEKGGKVVPDFIPAKQPSPKLNKFDSESVEDDVIPLSDQHEFRKDIRRSSWEGVVSKWSSRLQLSEKQLKEQAKKLAPSYFKGKK